MEVREKGRNITPRSIRFQTCADCTTVSNGNVRGKWAGIAQSVVCWVRCPA